MKDSQPLSPHSAATALLALIDSLLRLCTRHDQSAEPMADVAPAIDAAGLRGGRR